MSSLHRSVICSAETGPSAANSASSTSRREAVRRNPRSRRTATASSRLPHASGGASGATVMGSTLALVEVRAPARLDPAEAPDQQCDRPCGAEHPDDHKPEQVDVDVLKPVPERTPEAEVLGDQAAEFDC